jgi:hypothetical protein
LSLWDLLAEATRVPLDAQAPVEVLLGLLLGGLSIGFGASRAIGSSAEWDTEENFYKRVTGTKIVWGVVLPVAKVS